MEYVSFRDALIEENRRVVGAVGGAGRLAKKAKAAPKKLKLPGCLKGFTQAQAKAYGPPGASLWLSRAGGGAWHSKMPPFTNECSRSWSKYGEEASLKLVLRFAWEKYCDINRLSYDAIGVEGL